MTDTWQKLSDITNAIVDRFQPVKFEIFLQRSIAIALVAEAARSGIKPETLIAEAVRSYMGEAA